ncbi:unnamed protein product, partial [Porites lobata]
TTLAWDNIDRLEETLSGEGTSHRVNGIAVQARNLAPIPSQSSHLGSPKVSKGVLSHLMLLLYPFTMQVSVKRPTPRAYMTHLEETHPEAHEFLKSGGFSVQIGDQNPFGRVPVDQTCEETVDNDTQTAGGTKGFSLKAGAVSKYYIVSEFRSIFFLKQLRDMLNLSKSNSAHTDLQKTRIARDEADVKSLIAMLESNWINPFSAEQQDLIILKADRARFGQMVIIAENRQLHMRDVLCHPLGPLPWALSVVDGSLRKTSKAALAKELQKNVPAAEEIAQPSACIIDGMVLVQRLKGDHKKFSDVAESLFGIVLHEGASSKRIDVIFDVYRENSIKNTEREHRGAEYGNEFRNLQPDHKVQHWRKFLLDPQNKKALTIFVSKEWKQDKYRKKLTGKGHICSL